MIALFLNSRSKKTRLNETYRLFSIFVVEARFGIFQAIIIAMLNVTTAQFVFITYGSNIVQRSGTVLSPGVASISMAIFQLLASFGTLLLVDKKGRKFLLVISLAGCAISHGLMIVYLHLESVGVDTVMFNWTPIVSMTSVIFTSSIGIVPLTLVCMVESFPEKTRSFGMALGTTISNLMTFGAAKIYPILEYEIGLESCLMIFCGGCIFGVLYSILVVKETKDKELNAVDKPELPRSESFVANQNA